MIAVGAENVECLPIPKEIMKQAGRYTLSIPTYSLAMLTKLSAGDY
jgi:hypothetical protein